MPYIIDIGKCYSFKEWLIADNIRDGFGYDLFMDTITNAELRPLSVANRESNFATPVDTGFIVTSTSSWRRTTQANLMNWNEERTRQQQRVISTTTTTTISLPGSHEIIPDLDNMRINLIFTDGSREIHVNPILMLDTGQTHAQLGGLLTPVLVADNLNTSAINNLGKTIVAVRFGVTSIDLRIVTITRIQHTFRSQRQTRNVLFGIPNNTSDWGIIANTTRNTERITAVAFQLQVRSQILVRRAEEIGVGDTTSQHTIKGNQFLTATARLGNEALPSFIGREIAEGYSRGKDIKIFAYPLIDIIGHPNVVGYRNETIGGETIQVPILESPPTTKNMETARYIVFHDQFGRPEYLEDDRTTPKIFELMSCELKRNEWRCLAIEMK